MEVNFINREDAGKQLALKLKEYADTDAVILGLPRGGMVVAKEMADYLKKPLDVIIVRKIGHPFNPEYAVGAVSENGNTIYDEKAIRDLDPMWLSEETAKQLEEAKRRRDIYTGSQKEIDLKDKIAIIVDDGLATGLTMEAAIREVKLRNPAKIVVAVAVSSQEIANKIKKEVDDFVAVLIPEVFMGAIGYYYNNFSQVSDDEVIELLSDYQPKFILFNMPIYEELAEKIHSTLPELSHDLYDFVHFPNREVQIILEDEIEKHNCFFLGTISPPEEQIIEALLTCHTIKKEGVKKVIGIFPYLAYMRQDKNEHRKSLATDWIAKTMEASGIDEIATIDIHSDFDLDFFKISVISLSPAEIFANEIKRINMENAVLVAPDEGAIHRCETVKKLIENDKDIVYFEKSRLEGSIEMKMHGELGPEVIIIDDILDTGNTLISCANQLKENGVKKLIIMVTHGLFTGEIWPELFNFGVEKIYTTDTVPITRENMPDNIIVLPTIGLLRNYILEKISTAI